MTGEGGAARGGVMDWVGLFSQSGLVDGSDTTTIADAISWFTHAWQGFAAWVARWRATLDPAIWLIGGILALVPGSFAIVKWWNYRNSRLPQRLDEILTKDESRLREARSALAKAIIKPAPINSPIAYPLFLAPTMTSLLKRLNWSRWWRPISFTTCDTDLEVALAEIEGKLQFCARKEALHREQEAAAYLLKGAVAAATASKFDPTSGDCSKHNRIALNHFNRALEIDPNDAEALEYVAHQYRVLQQIELAQAAYEKLIELATGSSVQSRATRSRAHRYAGEMLEKKYERTKVAANLQRARDHLDLEGGALECIPIEERGSLDHAAIHEVTGRVTEKLEFAALPAHHYGQALAIYSDLMRREPSNKDAADGTDRMIRALSAFHADDAPVVVQ